MENGEIILGIDLSTSVIGLTLFYHDEKNRDNDNIILMEGLNLKIKELKNIKGIESLFLKKKIFEKRFNELQSIIFSEFSKKISKIIIEEPLLQSNNCNTVAILIRFNAIISDYIYTQTGILPIYLTSYNARKYAFPHLYTVRKYDKKGRLLSANEIAKNEESGKRYLFGDYPLDVDKKSIIQQEIAKLYPQLEWQCDKNGKLLTSMYDAADSLAVVLGYININKN